jgi:hypothetical protein
MLDEELIGNEDCAKKQDRCVVNICLCSSEFSGYATQDTATLDCRIYILCLAITQQVAKIEWDIRAF